MQVVVNGNEREVSSAVTIADLLKELDIVARHVAVEVNQELVPRTHHAQHRLAPGDRLEVVTLVGGG